LRQTLPRNSSEGPHGPPNTLARPALSFLFLLTAVVIGSAAVLGLVRRHQDRLHLATNGAHWIWLSSEFGEERAPLGFFAAKDFDWEGGGQGPARALLFVDRRYTFSFNGARVGEGEKKPGDPLDAYDVSRSLVRGRNRIRIGVESPDGAGGVLFLLTLPDGSRIASGPSWKVAKTEQELESRPHFAAVWGRPPMHPWGYPAATGR